MLTTLSIISAGGCFRPPCDYDDRRVKVYFGPSRKVEVTKEVLAEFIIEEMSLEQSDGGPKWTESVAELIKLGMEAFEEATSKPVHSEIAFPFRVDDPFVEILRPRRSD
ncbi:hypothetical protein [Salinibaculum salinum]|uniref:hypothetical protein n=1 Tax=Salinibaculum salinum TaxID=3131996 RepID=UPI0030EB8970